jgi:SAM-dependent methyltransferase
VNEASANPWDHREAALLYDRVHHGEDDVRLLLQLARDSGGPVLDVGCGTGRCLIPFIREGYDTVGLDRSEAMLDVLRMKLKREPDDTRHRATPLQGDGRDFSIPLRFGMAIAGMDAYCHFQSRQEQASFVANVFAHLRPGAIVFLDVFNPTVGWPGQQRARWESETARVVETVAARDSANQKLAVETVISYEGRAAVHVTWELRFSHRFELELQLEKSGFEIVAVWGGYDRQPFTDAAARLIVIARKPPPLAPSQIRYMRDEVTIPA